MTEKSKKPSASRTARGKSNSSFYDKLRKGITGDKTEIKPGAKKLKEELQGYGGPAKHLAAAGAVRKPPGYGSAARGGDGNGLGASKQEKPPGYGAPAKDLTPGTKVGGRSVRLESEGKHLRTIIGE